MLYRGAGQTQGRFRLFAFGDVADNGQGLIGADAAHASFVIVQGLADGSLVFKNGHGAGCEHLLQILHRRFRNLRRQDFRHRFAQEEFRRRQQFLPGLGLEVQEDAVLVKDEHHVRDGLQQRPVTGGTCFCCGVQLCILQRRRDLPGQRLEHIQIGLGEIPRHIVLHVKDAEHLAPGDGRHCYLALGIGEQRVGQEVRVLRHIVDQHDFFSPSGSGDKTLLTVEGDAVSLFHHDAPWLAIAGAEFELARRLIHRVDMHVVEPKPLFAQRDHGL